LDTTSRLRTYTAEEEEAAAAATGTVVFTTCTKRAVDVLWSCVPLLQARIRVSSSTRLFRTPLRDDCCAEINHTIARDVLHLQTGGMSHLGS